MSQRESHIAALAILIGLAIGLWIGKQPSTKLSYSGPSLEEQEERKAKWDKQREDAEDAFIVKIVAGMRSA